MGLGRGVVTNPEFLYHGRHDLTNLIPLEQAMDIKGDPKQNLFAIYATQVKDYASYFAIDQIHFKKGYVYKLHSDNFKHILDAEWVSFVPEIPISCEIVYPLEYIHYRLNGRWGKGRINRYVIPHGSQALTLKHDIEICLGDINMESEDKEDGKKVAKRILLMDIRRAIYKCEESNDFNKDNPLFLYLYDLLKKLEVNWDEYVT